MDTPVGAPREDCIRIQGMTFHGYHGVRPEERANGQRFVVDLALYRDVSLAAASDALADATDYSAIYQQVRDIVEGQPRNLLEALAVAIAEAVHARHGGLVWVRVTKPDRPSAAYAVEVWRPRAVTAG